MRKKFWYQDINALSGFIPEIFCLTVCAFSHFSPRTKTNAVAQNKVNFISKQRALYFSITYIANIYFTFYTTASKMLKLWKWGMQKKKHKVSRPWCVGKQSEHSSHNAAKIYYFLVQDIHFSVAFGALWTTGTYKRPIWPNSLLNSMIFRCDSIS